MENVALEKYDNKFEADVVPMITDFWRGFGNNSTDEGSRENIAEWSEEGHYFYVIITLGGEAVGFIHSGKYGSVKWINELYVLPAFRGRGIAKRAIAMLEEILRNGGAEAVCMDVVAANTDTLRLYHGLGFDRISLVTVRKDFEKPEYFRTENFGGLEFNIRKPIDL